MRLIDADALAKELMHEGLGYQYNRVMCAPTVNAIPVEWIHDIISLSNSVGANWYAMNLEILLNDWKEERNEIDNISAVEYIPVSFLLKLQETAVNDEAREIINEIIARWEIERKEE